MKAFRRKIFWPTLVGLILLPACGEIQPVTIRSDPSQERQERLEQKADSDNVAAYIIAHPELDSLTKKELRDGKLTPHEVDERLKHNPPKENGN